MLETYMPDITNDEKTITIEVQNEYKITRITIQQNSFTRHLEFTTNELAYTCDIDALNKKIDMVAEQSQVNDLDMYATVDEVNDVLLNN